MPELPEVETVKRALEPVLGGRIIVRTEVFSPDICNGTVGPISALTGRKILHISRRARYIIVQLDDGNALVVHLGMTGVIRIETGAVPRRKHEHIFLYLDNGMIFRFEDVRRFGFLGVYPCSENGLPGRFALFGPEPLTDEFTADYLYGCSRGVKRAVKNFIMDNRTVAGIGNIYAAEILFAARIDPRKMAGKLSLAQCRQIAIQAKRILQEAIEAGGTTIADFRQIDGSEGKFAVSLQIYGKAGKSCPVCGMELKSVKLSGRSSVFCPKCQR